MAKEWAKAFYNSTAWQKCRGSYIKKVFGLCEVCERPGYIVHHKIALTPKNINNAEITLNHNNLMYACKDCHEKFRYSEDVRYRFDDDGMPMPP